jgi:peptidoglycan/xylan/chitin deacetylase (PgdA/CDA1 family)
MRLPVFKLLHGMGLIQLHRFVHRNSLVILMLHGVMDDDAPSHWVPLRPQLSRRSLNLTLKVLSDYYHFISLADAADMLAGRIPFKPNSLVWTFDDGYRNQLKYALPALRNFNAPLTIFLTTGHIEHRKPFWFDRLDYALQHTRLAGREFKVGNEIIRFTSNDRADVRASFKQLRNAAKRADRPDCLMTQEMESLAERLETESGHRLADIFEHDDWSCLLDWSEIRAAGAQSLVTFGSHTVDHTRLGLATEGEISDQARYSKDAIEGHTGKECRFFCFPSGSFSARSMAILQECGYAAAVTTTEGFNTPKDNPMALRRISLPASDRRCDILRQTLLLAHPLKSFGLGRSNSRVDECILGD